MEKMLVNGLYHSDVVSGLAIGYSRLGKMAIGVAAPKFDFTPRDVGMVVVDVAIAMSTKDMIINSMHPCRYNEVDTMASIARQVGGA